MSQTAGLRQTLTTNVHDTALILEGGGMRASYTSALIERFIRDEIWFDWVGGISAGSSLTVNYLSRDRRRTKQSFVDFAADPQFGSWLTWMQGKGRFSAEFIYQRSAEAGQALPYDWQTFETNPAEFAVGAFAMRSGKMQYWGRKDIRKRRDLMLRVQASSTLPILMPPVSIDGEVFVDGALGPTGGFAIDAAIAAGYEKFVVVMTRPRDYVKPPARIPSFYRSVFRRYPAMVNGILQRTARYNATRERLFALEQQGRAYLFLPENLTVSNTETNVTKLARQYTLGSEQTDREIDAIRAFVGL